MDVFFVVVLALAALAVGVTALVVALRLKRHMDPTDSQER